MAEQKEKKYIGTHGGVKIGRNLQPKEPANPNRKAVKRLAQRLESHKKDPVKGVNSPTMPGSMNRWNH